MDRFLDPHQARRREPTQYENLLGDAIERAYAQGITELPALVGYLNETGFLSQQGTSWTETSFTTEMTRLSAD